jgi:LysM domain
MSALSAIEAPVGTGAGGPQQAAQLSERRRRHLRPVAAQVQPAAAEPGGGTRTTRQPRSSSMTPSVQLLPARPGQASIRSELAVRRPYSRPGGSVRPVSRPGGSVRPVSRPGGSAWPTPLRLTRRGRAALSCLLIAGLTCAALGLSLVASGRAQATNHGQDRAVYHGMRELVVQPGQTLWSIASAAEPSANTGAVVEQIISVNALAGTNIRAGQLLWVPR